jgi:hypothetical protein
LAFCTLLVLGSGCASAQLPPPQKARKPSPGTVTRDNPAGDAASPIDAANTRLLNEPMGDQHDRWRKLGVPLPDAENWKRVRFWGYPTRAGFRYGKDPHFALGLIAYEPAEGEDDSPTACLRQFSKRALETAALFDVEVSEVTREMRTHKRGPEGVDWDEAGKAWKEERARREAERQERLAERRKLGRLRHLQRQAARKAAAEKAAAEKAAQQQAGTAPPPAQTEQKEPAGKPETEAPQSDQAPDGAQPKPNGRARLGGMRRLFLKSTGEAGTGDAGTGDAAQPSTTAPTDPAAAAEAAQKRKERIAKIRAIRLRMKQAREAAEAVTPLPENLPASNLAVLRTTGRFTTLFNRDVYQVAVVAYDSWPGTCLVQGFAVRTGADEKLAVKVLERWLEEAAPNLRWDPTLREKPIFENR